MFREAPGHPGKHFADSVKSPLAAIPVCGGLDGSLADDQTTLQVPEYELSSEPMILKGPERITGLQKEERTGPYVSPGDTQEPSQARLLTAPANG